MTRIHAVKEWFSSHGPLVSLIPQFPQLEPETLSVFSRISMIAKKKGPSVSRKTPVGSPGKKSPFHLFFYLTKILATSYGLIYRSVWQKPVDLVN
jgi:hypothetical protein